MANNEKNLYLYRDSHGHQFKDYFDKQKRVRLKERVTAIWYNRQMRRNRLPTTELPPKYTLTEFAKDLDCAASTLRKFMTGHGRLPFDLLGRLEYLTKRQKNDNAEEYFKKVFIPTRKIRQCRREECHETFILFAHNKLDCDFHAGKSKQKYPCQRDMHHIRPQVRK